MRKCLYLRAAELQQEAQRLQETNHRSSQAWREETIEALSWGQVRPRDLDVLRKDPIRKKPHAGAQAMFVRGTVQAQDLATVLRGHCASLALLEWYLFRVEGDWNLVLAALSECQKLNAITIKYSLGHHTPDDQLALAQRLKRLPHLQHFTAQGTTACKILADTLEPTNRSIRTISIMGEEDHVPLRNLFPKLQAVHQLRSLSIEQSLPRHYLSRIQNLLQTTTSLQTLALKFMEPICAVGIAQALCNNRSLRTLVLHNHKNHSLASPEDPVEEEILSTIDQETEAFHQVLGQSNFTLTSLDRTPWTDDGYNHSTQQRLLSPKAQKHKAWIRFLLHLNQRGDRAKLQTNTSDSRIWMDYIIDHKDDIAITFYYLSLNPSLILRMQRLLSLQADAAKVENPSLVHKDIHSVPTIVVANPSRRVPTPLPQQQPTEPISWTVADNLPPRTLEETKNYGCKTNWKDKNSQWLAGVLGYSHGAFFRPFP